MKKVIITCITILSLSTLAIAEGHDTGGGDAIICTERKAGKDFKQPYFADTFALRNSAAATFLNQMSAESGQKFLIALLEELKPEKTYPHPHLKGEKVSHAWMVNYLMRSAMYRWHIEDADEAVFELEDDNIILEQYPENCREKKQLAIQNIDQRIIRYNHRTLYKMKSFDRLAFRYHEALIALRDQPGADTTPLRESVHDLFFYNESRLLAIRHERQTLVHRRIQDRYSEEIRNKLSKAREIQRKYSCYAHISLFHYKHQNHLAETPDAPECEEYYSLKEDVDQVLGSLRYNAFKVPTELPKELNCYGQLDQDWFKKIHVKEVSEKKYSISFWNEENVMIDQFQSEEQIFFSSDKSRSRGNTYDLESEVGEFIMHADWKRDRTKLRFKIDPDSYDPFSHQIHAYILHENYALSRQFSKYPIKKMVTCYTSPIQWEN